MVDVRSVAANRPIRELETNFVSCMVEACVLEGSHTNVMFQERRRRPK